VNDVSCRPALTHGLRSMRGALLVLVLAAAGATAEETSLAQAPALDAAQPKPEALYAAPTREDRVGRIHAAVEIDGRGPYRFIVDTGANSSALAPRVADELALPPADGGVVQVHGVTGVALLPAVHVDSLRVGGIVLPPSTLPVLPGDIFAGADGILGVAGIQQMRLDVDFANDRVEIALSSGRRAPVGYVTVRASLWQGGLLLVKGRVGGVTTKVIIDTGAERTMGNMQLRAALHRKARRGEEAETTVRGATPDVSEGTYFKVPRISIGPAQLVDLPVAFGELHVFELWGLNEEPALVVGMDVLGRLERFVIDYKRQEFQMKSSGPKGVSVRRCTSSTCGSRIPEKPYWP
jgi:predicted aspartyl protease